MKQTTVRRGAKLRDNFSSIFVAGLPLLGFVLFGIIPLALSAVVSLNELHTTDLSQMSFIGFENFKTILTNGDNRTYASYFTTLVYALNVPICIAMALFIANLVNKTKLGQRLFRSIFFIPYVCSAVVVSLMFKTLYANDNGVLNVILTNLGFSKVEWLTKSPWVFMIATIIMTVWQGLGLCIVLFQAALSNVDRSYYEAALIDGASSRTMFWKITWPAISPTTAYLVTMKLIWAFQAMAETHILSSGNATVPVWGTSEAWVSDTVVKHIYNMMFSASYQYGYGTAAAAGWVLAIIVLIITRVNLKLQDRWVNYDF